MMSRLKVLALTSAVCIFALSALVAAPSSAGSVGDFDNDLIWDEVDNCWLVPNNDQQDTDGDGIGDACDDTNGNDLDDDGVNNNSDNCPDTDNPNQTDTDVDGVGDACDDWPDDPNDDADGDGVSGDIDNCPDLENADQADTDGDGIGDACDDTNDDDGDGDGIDDESDNCADVSNEDQTDTDDDGEGDACDDDNDGDGEPDDTDNCPNAENPNQEDYDEDGKGAACDEGDNPPIDPCNLGLRGDELTDEVPTETECGGTITITKYTNITTEDTWDFDIDPDAEGAEGIDVDDVGAGDTATVDELPAGSYDVSENEEGPWTVGYAYCYSDGYEGGWQTGNTISNVSLSNGETVDCYFYNDTTNGFIEIMKVTDVETTDTFDFNINQGGEGFSGGVDDLGSGETSDPVVVPAGTYDVSEIVPEGWDLVDAECVDQARQQEFIPLEPVETGTFDGDSVNGAVVQAGHTVLCTFHDNQVVDRGPTPSQDVCFNIAGDQATVPPGFELDERGNCNPPTTVTDLCPNIEGDQADVPEGMVVDDQGNCVPEPGPEDLCPNIDGLQEAIPEGMVVEDGDCVPSASITLVNAIKAGSDKTLKFTFTFHHDENFLTSYLADLKTDGTVELGDGESDRVDNLAVGNYTLSEEGKEGWDSPTIDCGPADVSLSDSSVQVHLGPAQHVTCVFNNAEKDKVLGEVISRGPKPPAVAAGVLPFTGNRILFFGYIGLVLLLIGGSLILSLRKEELVRRD